MRYEKEIIVLRRMIEQSIGQQISSPADFQFLKDEISKRLGSSVSTSTLKRVWEYVSVYTNPTNHTLTSLAQFIGFHNWDDFLNNYNSNVDSSHRVVGSSISVASFAKGQRICVRWAPDRRCTFECCGDGTFVVVCSENSKLQVGDSFRIADIIIGEPLYLYDFVHNGSSPAIFVIGQNGGISEVKIEA